eukprot:8276593-Alexandrium_andersonii.AAC.1
MMTNAWASAWSGLANQRLSSDASTRLTDATPATGHRATGTSQSAGSKLASGPDGGLLLGLAADKVRGPGHRGLGGLQDALDGRRDVRLLEVEVLQSM